MEFQKAYVSWEEFQREELRRLERIDMGIDDLLGEFDADERALKREARREGLFDGYDSEEEEEESEDF
jgi:DNA relaxase NicK